MITEFTLEKVKEVIETNRIGHIRLTDLAEEKIRGKEQEVKISRWNLRRKMRKKSGMISLHGAGGIFFKKIVE